MGKSEMNAEIVGDAMDMMDGDTAADADEVYNGILGEIGLQGASQMGGPVSAAGIA